MAARKSPLDRLREVCLALPEAEELISHGAPVFRIKKNRTYACFADNHHGDGRVATWVKATISTQELLVDAQPDRYFVPPYVGKSGWVGVILDARTDWSTLAELVEDGWRAIAPRKLLAAAGNAGEPATANPSRPRGKPRRPAPKKRRAGP